MLLEQLLKWPREDSERSLDVQIHFFLREVKRAVLLELFLERALHELFVSR